MNPAVSFVGSWHICVSPSAGRVVAISDLDPATVSDLSVAGLRSINLEFHSFGCRLAQGSMVAT